MFKSINAFFARVLLAALLVTGTSAALAGPVYHVSVDTSTWSGNGYLNLTMTGLGNAPPVTTRVSNFKGSFGSTNSTQGQVSGDVMSIVTLVQGPSFNEILQDIDFGGTFSFDVSFEVPQGVLNGSNFGVALVNASGTDYAPGTNGDIAGVALMPEAADALWVDRRFASIAEVPEPGSAATVVLGLLLVGWCRTRTQAGSGRTRT